MSTKRVLENCSENWELAFQREGAGSLEHGVNHPLGQFIRRNRCGKS